jgi:AcrR family transcriptional regulator
VRTRQRNPRGEGSRLREEIVDAAARLVDAGGPERVTLRGVAREAGISAPSIYDHFADRAEILWALKLRFLAELEVHIRAALDQHTDPVRRLDAGCEAYVNFSDRWPARYAYMFGYEPASAAGAPHEPPPAEGNPFETLVDGISDCVDAGRSSSADPRGDATAVWSALHGYAGLHSANPSFPWPDREEMLQRIVRGLARITS